jgi:ankyrin repeat protein
MQTRLGGLRQCRAIRTGKSSPSNSEQEILSSNNAIGAQELDLGVSIPLDRLHAPVPDEPPFDLWQDVFLGLRGSSPNHYDTAALANTATDAADNSSLLPSALAASARFDGKRPASSEMACSPSKAARRQSPEALLSESSHQLKQTSIRYDGRELSDLITRASLLARLCWKYSPSYVADVLSLRSRFSRTCSWKSRPSSTISSIVSQEATANSRVSFNSRSCWCHTEPCLHEQLATVVNSCLSNSFVPSQLSEIDVTAMDRFKNGPLHIAAQAAAPFSVFEALIYAGADIHAINAYGETFLHIFDPSYVLRESWWLQNLLTLLEHRQFDFNARDHSGRSILLCLLQYRSFHDDPTLLSTFTSCLTRREDLWLSCLCRDRTGLNAHTHLREMIKRGTSTTQHCCYSEMDENYRPFTAMFDFTEPELLTTASLATRRTLKSLVLLFDRGHIWDDSKPNTLHQVAQFSSWPDSEEVVGARKNRIDQLLEAGFDIDAYDEKGYTPLMLVTMHHRRNETGEETATIVKHLISKGASIHRLDRRGNSLLHLALERGLMIVTKLLIKEGANVNAITDAGHSVLKTAYNKLRWTRKKQHVYAHIMACITLLIDHGALADPTTEQIWS